MTKPPIVDPPLSGLFNAVPKGAGLLAVDEPAPFSFERLSGRAPAVLICDHASRYIPRALGTLGLDAADLARHIAWDIGAGEVVRHLAKRLDVPAVLSGFSRLAVDPNRHLQSRFSIPTDSDGTPIPGNRDLTTAARRQRIDSLFMPYHAAVSRLIEAKVASGQSPVLIFVHSFTPVMQGDERPWEAGILWDRDPRAALPLIDALRARGLAVGDNEPYTGRSPEDYSLHAHGEERGLPCALIELRQDLIDTHHGAEHWAGVLVDVLQPLICDPTVFAPLDSLAMEAAS